MLTAHLPAKRSTNQVALDFLIHAEKTILRHSNELRRLCSHPRKVVSRKARQFYAQQLYLYRIHQDLLAALSPSLSGAPQERVLSEIEVLKEMQLRLATRFFRFLQRNRTNAARPAAATLAKIA